MSSTIASGREHSTTNGSLRVAIARSCAELESAFQLVYQSYRRAGLATPNDVGMRLTPFHLLPMTEVILAFSDGIPISTASLMLDEQLGLPAESIYAEEIGNLRSRGYRLAEVGSFADRRGSPRSFIGMFGRLSAMIAQAAAFRGCNGLIAATHPRHARFYIRQFGFEQFGELRACPYAQGNPAVALLLDFEKHQDTEVGERLFGTPYRADELEPFHWGSQTRHHFAYLLRRSQRWTGISSDDNFNPTIKSNEATVTSFVYTAAL